MDEPEVSYETVTNEDGETVKKPMEISELHPWGIVHGAGDLRYRKETIMILR